MTDPFPTLLPITPHTQAKHKILRLYLEAWIAILSRQSSKVGGRGKEILFVDGFAGPGIYETGEPGSPIIAISAALSHGEDLPVPVRFLFIEQREDRHRSLQTELEKLSEPIANCSTIRLSSPVQGDCATELGRVLDECSRSSQKFGPALVFLDQFGYSQVPMELIGRIMEHPQCEVFSYLNYKRLVQFMADAGKQTGISNAWGSEEWRGALKLRGGLKRNFVKESYKSALKGHAKAKYVLDFAMCGDDGSVLYWLFFCTNNIRGIEEMKRAMWKLDDSGTFRFSDKDDPDQLRLLSGCTQDWLAHELSRDLRGHALSLDEIKEYVLTETPCYLYKQALKTLERSERLLVTNAPSNRRTGTFSSEQLCLRFIG